MPGDQTTPNFAAMTPEQFREWQLSTIDHTPPPAGADLTSPAPLQTSLGSAAPKPEPRSDVWGSKKVAKDFVCPSGQTCRLLPLQPHTLLEKGLLDRIARLEGLSAELVDAAEGQPPASVQAPTSEELKGVLDLLNLVLPLVIAEPKVYEDDDKDAPEDAIRVRDIDLDDRMAILEESMKGLKALDRFRPAG
jgi:hypothetical protein